MYSGAVDYDQIAAAKKAVDCPVIANGGVFSAADADRLISLTGADGVMIARGAMYDPFLFAVIAGVEVPDKKAAIASQIEDTFAAYDYRFATVFMRKMLSFYIKGQAGAAATRVKLMGANSKEEIEDILDGLEFNG